MMPKIISIGEAVPPFVHRQEEVMRFAQDLFSSSFKDFGRLLNAFKNGEIEKRHFVKEMDWYKENRSLEEKNNTYIHAAVELGIKAINECLKNKFFLHKGISYKEIEAIFFISTTGLATPSIDARIMNELQFRSNTKRIPIWGLGCAGGVSGLARAAEYCIAFPKAMVLVLSVELCSLTFQKDDHSKSNLIGTTLFGDGAGCVLVCGDEVDCEIYQRKTIPSIVAVQSKLMRDSLNVMGWNIKNAGLFVVFSRDIPQIIKEWLKPNVLQLLEENKVKFEQIQYFIAHPGGKKVLDAYENSLGFHSSMTRLSLEVLKQFGNMSSATVFFVLKKHMELEIKDGEYGLCAALGPGFSSELLLMRWVS
jgi:alkylresorcinol/alkylpyrone synthase